jgi:hypothetical protein
MSILRRPGGFRFACPFFILFSSPIKFEESAMPWAISRPDLLAQQILEHVLIQLSLIDIDSGPRSRAASERAWIRTGWRLTAEPWRVIGWPNHASISSTRILDLNS